MGDAYTRCTSSSSTAARSSCAASRNLSAILAVAPTLYQNACVSPAPREGGGRRAVLCVKGRDLVCVHVQKLVLTQAVGRSCCRAAVRLRPDLAAAQLLSLSPLPPALAPRGEGEQTRTRAVAATSSSTRDAARRSAASASADDAIALRHCCAAHAMEGAASPTPDTRHLAWPAYAEVYPPAEDSYLLMDALEADRARLVAQRPLLCWEIGCVSACSPRRQQPAR
jgi:hypothetical protein